MASRLGISLNPCWFPWKNQKSQMKISMKIEILVRHNLLRKRGQILMMTTNMALFPCGAARWIHRPHCTLTCASFFFLYPYQKPDRLTTSNKLIIKQNSRLSRSRVGSCLWNKNAFITPFRYLRVSLFLPKYCSFKYLCDAVLTITNVFSKDLRNNSLLTGPDQGKPHSDWPHLMTLRGQCPAR